jgi:hypothetical protein
MLKNIDIGDRIALGGVLIGLLAVFMPWYGYTAGASHVSVNGFRASLLGVLFFLALAAYALLVLMRHGVVADVIGGRIEDRSARMVAGGVALGAVLLQLLIVAIGARSASAGLACAFIAVCMLFAGAWLRQRDVEHRRTVREMLGEGVPD